MDTITARITTHWLLAAREQLAQAERDHRPSSIAAAKATLADVLIVIAQVQAEQSA